MRAPSETRERNIVTIQPKLVDDVKLTTLGPRSFLYWMNIENCPLCICTWINTTHWKWKPFSLCRFRKGFRPFGERAHGPPKTFILDGYFCVVLIVVQTPVYNRRTHARMHIQASDITTIASKRMRCEHWLANGKRFSSQIKILMRFNRNSQNRNVHVSMVICFGILSCCFRKRAIKSKTI